MRVCNRMTPDPITAGPKTTHREAMALMKENNISHLPVVDSRGRVAGIISETDLLSTGPSRVTSLSFYELYTLLDTLTLDQIMSKPVLAVEEECSLSSAANYMIQHDVGSLLVVKDGELTGIITDTDIFKTFVEMLAGDQSGARIDVRVADEKGMLAQAMQAFADAGSYVFSVSTFQDEDGKYTLASIKETGTTRERLQAEIDRRPGVTLLEFRPLDEDRLICLGE